MQVFSVPGAFTLPRWVSVNFGLFFDGSSTVLQPGAPGSQGGASAKAEPTGIAKASAVRMLAVRVLRFLDFLLALAGGCLLYVADCYLSKGRGPSSVRVGLPFCPCASHAGEFAFPGGKQVG